MNQNDIQNVIFRVPDLTMFGVGLSDSERGLNAAERTTAVKKSQEDLLESESTCTEICWWLDRIAMTESVNMRRSSYGLKRIAEDSIGIYIPNGAFIAAAIHQGFPYRLFKNSPDARFGMCEQSLNTLGRAYSPRSSGSLERKTLFNSIA